jgi:hypothetical protein
MVQKTHSVVRAVGLVMLASAVSAAREPRDLEEVGRVLDAAAEHSVVDVVPIGASVTGRAIRAVRLGSRSEQARWRVLLIGRQHGNEPAGGEALVELVDRVARSEAHVPPDTTVWVVPIANPDGAVVNERRNAAGADLNRDHLLLSQPETRALHALARKVRAHVIVDCHEFTRDSADYLERGWGEWPLITMDTANHPLLPDATYQVGLEWLDRAARRMGEAGYSYRRYLVGGVPPEEEMRPSTLDGDDARNGLALYGSLGFIIESGIRRRADNPNADLDQRVAAYLELLDLLVADRSLRERSRRVVAELREQAAPRFLPTNVFWANAEGAVSSIKVVDLESGLVDEVETPNLMLDRVAKRSVTAPAGYVVDAGAAGLLRGLLERNELVFEVLGEPATLVVEPVRLLRVEEEWDPVYSRYGGRQITEVLPAATLAFEPGSLVVRLDGGQWRRAVALLEPGLLFGLYQYQVHRDSVSARGIVPVARLVER